MIMNWKSIYNCIEMLYSKHILREWEASNNSLFYFIKDKLSWYESMVKALDKKDFAASSDDVFFKGSFTFMRFNNLIHRLVEAYTSYNNVYGQRITGPNGKSIFLPCSGYYSFKRLLGQGSCGWYWSSSLSNNNEKGKAVKLFFPNNSCENKAELLQNDLRYRGGSVRPVLANGR